MPSYRKSAIFVHCLGWFFFALMPVLFIMGRSHRNITEIVFTLPFIEFMVTYIVVFYLLYLWIIPTFLLRGKYLVFGSLLLALFIGISYIMPFDNLVRSFSARNNPRMVLRPNIRFDIVSTVLFLLAIAFAVVIQITRRWQLESERAARAEAGKANAELSFLKAQVHPHFLFNTLNNIYSMAVMNHAQTAESLLKLSNIMRYVTDEISEDFVPLKDEVACIRDYIDLQRLRAGGKVDVDFQVLGDISNKKIAPLIFMSFIENVFKYGISKHENCSIKILMAVQQLGISLFCQNRIFEQVNSKKISGIGISNAKQRLELLYPDKHSLHIESKNGLFTVDLVLLST